METRKTRRGSGGARPGAGRKPLPGKKVQLSARVEPWLARWLAREAESQGESLSLYAARLLDEAARKRGAAPALTDEERAALLSQRARIDALLDGLLSPPLSHEKSFEKSLDE